MSLRQDLLYAQDDILDDLSDLVDKYKQQRTVRVSTVRPSYPTGSINTHRASGIEPVYNPYPYRGTISSPIQGIDKSTYDHLSKLAQTAISEPKKQKDSIMSIFNSIPGLSGASFGKLPAGKIAIDFSGQVVFKKPNGGGYVKVQTDAEGNKTQIDTLDIKFDVDFYRVPTQTLAVGDLVELDGALLYVEENTKGGIKFVNPLTGNKSSKLPQNNIFNMHFYTKIVSMFDLAGGQQAGIGLNGINPMMLMALQGKNGVSGDISELLVLSSLMGATQGQSGGVASPFGQMNPMMLMMLGDNAGSDTMKQFMMLQMFAGQGGANPFAPVSAAVPQAPVVAQAAAKVVRKTTTATTAKVAAKKTATPKKAATKATKVS